MRVGRWASAASVAVALAVVPGALSLAPDRQVSVERAPVAGLGRVGPVEAAPDEIAITPPGELVGELAEPTAPPPTFAPPVVERADGQVFALLIGIDDYPGQRSDLDSAVADADTIDAALDGFGVPDGNRVVLRNGQARLPDVVTAVQSLVAQGGPGATLVFGYAGHVRKLDSDTEALVLADGQTLTDAKLAALLAPATSQRMWLLLATCFAGGFTELLGPGRVLTGAADANHLAYESSSLNASFLVHYMVRMAWLHGAAGPSVQEAYAYADAALAREHPLRRPVQFDESGARLVLGAGDPTSAAGQAPQPPLPSEPASPGPSSPPTTSPPTTAPPPEEDHCLLGVLYC